MKRRGFLRGMLLGVGMALVPKVLQPFIPEVVEEENYCKGLFWHIQNSGNIVNYSVGSFTMQDFEDMIQAESKREVDRYIK